MTASCASGERARRPATSRRLARLVAGFIALMAGSGMAHAQDGSEIYHRCAACHQASGAGVGSVFPSLVTEPRLLAARPDGRRYLILAVIKGQSGPIMVGGKPYNGVMPAQGALEDGAVAAVLNYVTTAWSKAVPAPKPFTADEVKAIRAAGAALSPADVAKLQPKLAP